MRRKFLFILTAMFLLLPAAKGRAGMGDYCAAPPFVTQAVPPNILIVIDVSGSMQFPAYGPCDWEGYSYDHNHKNVAQCGISSVNYNPSREYYGYFKTDKYYRYSSHKFVENDNCNSMGPNCIPGNLLNWATMTRVDVMRKVLIGGKSVSQQQNAHTLRGEGGNWIFRDSNLHCEFEISGGSYPQLDHKITIRNYPSDESCTVGALHNADIKVDVPERERRGVIQNISDKDYDGNWDAGAPRFGLMVYAGDNRYGCMRAGIGGADMSSFINALQNEPPYAGTPTGEALVNALDYFEQDSFTYNCPGNSAYIGGPGSGKDPWEHWCQKSFILLISDGEWNGDVDPVRPAREGHLGIHEGRNYDLRSDLDGSQVVTTYTVYAFSDSQDGRNAMQQTAIYGGFKDLDSNHWPYPYTQYPPWDTWDNDPYGSRDVSLPNPQCDPNGTYNGSCKEWDKDGNGIPDNYYEAQEGAELQRKITQAIYDILKRASSGTAVSVLSTSTRGSATLNQAYFLPKKSSGSKELTWVGELRGFWVDPFGQIREDTDQSHTVTNSTAQLEYDKDNIMKFYFDDTDLKTKIYLFDSDSQGIVQNPCDLSKKINLSEAKTIWDIGYKLWNMDANNRHIFTGIDLNGDGKIDENDAFSTSYSSLTDYLRACDLEDAQNIINYVRGSDVDICTDSDNGSCSYSSCTKSHRDRTVTLNGNTKVWKLGDIVYSNPRILSHFPLGTYDIRYHDTSYREFIKEHIYDPTQADPVKRDDYLFVGANDGMLHCFYLGRIKEDPDPVNYPNVKAAVLDPSSNYDPGDEVWAYIPINTLPYLKYLAYPNYCHIYYVDQRPMLLDASINGNANAAKGEDSWRTILIGELRFGGSPNPPEDSPCIDSDGSLVSCSEDGAKKLGLSSIFALDITDPENPTLLWEFSDPDLGFTTSYPAVVRIGDSDKNGNWYVVLGSGPTDYDGDIPPSQGYIYVIDLRNGTLAKKLALPHPDTYVGDCVAVDPDNDYNVDAIYCGTVEKNGSTLSGEMLRILTNKASPENWTITSLVDADGPITASPAFTFDDQGNLWCYFGTGKYFGETDKSSESQQYIYGVKDPCWSYNNGSWSYASTCNAVTNIYDTTNVVVSAGQISDWKCMCEGGEVETCPNGNPAKGTDTDGNPTCNCGDMVVTKVTGVTVSGCGGSDGEDWQTCANRIANNYDGWKITLNVSSPAERVISKPSVIGQLAMFTTFTPNSDVCGFGGDSSLYSLYYKAGIPYKQPSILKEGAYLNGIIEKSVGIGQGVPAIGEGIVSKKVGKKLKSYIQLSTGQVVELTNQPVFMPEKVQFWIEK